MRNACLSLYDTTISQYDSRAMNFDSSKWMTKTKIELVSKILFVFLIMKYKICKLLRIQFI